MITRARRLRPEFGARKLAGNRAGGCRRFDGGHVPSVFSVYVPRFRRTPSMARRGSMNTVG